MASAFTHAYVGLVGSRILSRRVPRRFYAAAVVLSILPDADAILHALGVPYQNPFGHRGFSHSLLFALVVSMFTALMVFQTGVARRGFLLFLITASHGLLDAMSNGGLGVAFFWPFEDRRHFLPWQPIEVSPMSIRAFMSEWGVEVLVSEFFAVWVPLLFLFLSVAAVRWYLDADSDADSHADSQ